LAVIGSVFRGNGSAVTAIINISSHLVHRKNPVYTLTFERIIDAPAQVVWDVISDVEAYADYAPNLSQAIKTSDSAQPSRTCTDTRGKSWDEACVLWRDKEAYSYVVDTSAADYPYPFKYLQGTWGMETQADGVKVTMRFDYQPTAPSILGWFVHRAMKHSSVSIVETLFDNWESAMQTHHA